MTHVAGLVAIMTHILSKNAAKMANGDNWRPDMEISEY